MGDVLALFVAGVLCMQMFVWRTVRADSRAGTSTSPGWGGWLLVATAVVAVLSAVALGLSRLFSG